MVSVIVPVYNVEKYLHQCLDSILNQTYRDIEVILVNDGSSDNSGLICDAYVRRDQRVKVIHKKNAGASDARNIGLKIAKGEFVIFIDSDDYWNDSELLDRLCRQIGSYDFINFNCRYFYQKAEIFKFWDAYPEVVISDRNKKEKIIGLISHGLFPISPCLKLIRRQFLIENNILFLKGRSSEDIPWFLELVVKSRDFKFVNEYGYIYRKQVAESVSSSFSGKKYEDLFAIMKEEVKKIRQNPDVDLCDALLSFMAYEYCILMGMVNNFPVKVRKYQIRKLKEYNWLLQYESNPKVRKVKFLLRFAGTYLTRWVLFLYINEIVNRN